MQEPQNNQQQSHMSWQQHLEELRGRLIWSMGSFISASLLSFFFSDQLIIALQSVSPQVTFIQTTPGEVFFASVKLALYAGIGLSLPVILYHVIRFIMPGLSKAEKFWLLPFTLTSVLLFILGSWVGYSVVLPLMLNFLADYGQAVAKNYWEVSSYLNFATGFVFATGLLFQLPLACVVLNRLGLLTPQKMLANWRYAILGSVIIGAIVTPSADPVSQLIMSAILMGLYLVSIVLVAGFSKKQLAEKEVNLSPNQPDLPAIPELAEKAEQPVSV